MPAGSHPDAPAVEILAEVLGDTPSGRLHKALVDAKKATSVSSFFLDLKEPGFLLLRAEVRQDQSLEDAKTTMLQTIDGAVKTPPSKEEVERARAKILKNIELTMNSADRVGLQMSEWIGAGDWRLFFLNRDRIRKVTPEDVGRAAAAYLKPSNRTVGEFIPTAKPERAEIPSTPDVAALLKDYKGDAAIAAGEAFDPSPASIESRTLRSALAGGLKLALLPKKTRGATVVAAMTLRYGDEKSLVNRVTAAQLTGGMLTRGTARHTRQQIKDEFDRLRARVSIGGGPTQAVLSIETTRENLPAVLSLAAECLRESTFPAAEFETLKQETLASIEQGKSEPEQIAGTAYQRHLNPYPKGDVRYVPTSDEELAEVKATSLEDVKKFYSDFYGASNGELAIVGDIDAKAAGKLAQDLFDNWKSPRSYARVPGVYHDVAPAHESFEAPDKANAVLFAGMNLELRDDDPDYPALVLGNYMLGGGFLNSRLAVRIRQKEGLSYGVGSRLQASSLDKSGSFMTFAIYAPQNAGKLEAAFKEEIARVLKDGFEAKEVEEARSGWLQSRQVSRAQDAALARLLAQDLYLSRTLAWDAEMEKKVAALTPGPDRLGLAPPHRSREDHNREGRRLRESRSTRASSEVAKERLFMKLWISSAAVAGGCLAGSFLAGADAREVSRPPMAKKMTHVEAVHGDKLIDEYFWLRDRKNPEVKAYLETENAYADAFMKPTEAFQAKLYEEMLGRIKETDLSVPYPKGNYFYYSRTEKGKQYPIYCRKKAGAPGEPQGPRQRASRRGGRSDARPERDGQRRALHGGRRSRGLRRREPARLHQRQRRLPRVPASRQGPLDGQGLPRNG